MQVTKRAVERLVAGDEKAVAKRGDVHDRLTDSGVGCPLFYPTTVLAIINEHIPVIRHEQAAGQIEITGDISNWIRTCG